MWRGIAASRLGEKVKGTDILDMPALLKTFVINNLHVVGAVEATDDEKSKVVDFEAV